MLGQLVKFAATTGELRRVRPTHVTVYPVCPHPHAKPEVRERGGELGGGGGRTRHGNITCTRAAKKGVRHVLLMASAIVVWCASVCCPVPPPSPNKVILRV